MGAVSSFGEKYWLDRCEGFRVESPDGFVGWVEEVWYGASDEPEAVVVRSRDCARRVVSIPDGVVRVQPHRESVVLRSHPEMIELDAALETIS
jgi:hypothetical protein